jgi:hypothetical protein
VSANLALGYAAGALSTLSPCVLPILPIVLFDLTKRVSAIWHSFLRDALLRSVKTLLVADATRLAILCSCGGCECGPPRLPLRSALRTCSNSPLSFASKKGTDFRRRRPQGFSPHKATPTEW